MTNPYADAAADLAATGPANPYAAGAADMAQAQRTGLRAAVQGAAASTPEAASLARKVGLPPDVVQRNLPEVQQRLTVDRVDRDTADAPKLRERYLDPAFAAQAQDDSGPLRKVERAVGGVTAYLMGATPTGGLLGDVAAGYYRAGSGLAGTFRAVTELAAVPLDPLERVPSIGGNPLRRLAEGFHRVAQINAAEAERRTAPATGVLSSGVSSGVQSATQNLLMAPLALLPGGPTAALTGMAATTGGQSYEKARDAGLPQGTALAYGAGDAAIEFVTEKIPFSRLVGDLKTHAPMMRMVLRQAAADIPGEQVATILQDANEWATLNPEKTLGDFLRERPQAALQTLVSSIVGAGGNTAAMKGLHSAAARVHDRFLGAQQDLAGLHTVAQSIEAANASALKARDPGAFAELVQHLEPDAVVYVSPEHLQSVDLRAVPHLARQVEEATASGGDVQVTLADLLAHLPGDRLLEHLRVTPGATTLAEVNGMGDFATAMEAEVEQSAPERPPASPGSISDWLDQMGRVSAKRMAATGGAVDAAVHLVRNQDAQSLSDLRWLANRRSEALQALKRDAEIVRADIEQGAAAVVQAQPVYAAQRFLATPEGKALPADFVAERFGFSSGEAMHAAIGAAEKESRAIDRMANERMREQHPDLADRIARERAADAMVVERTRTRFLATEAAALSRAMGSRAELERRAEEFARAAIAERPVRLLRPAQFEAAAARAGRQAAHAFRRGDTESAARFKRAQVLQTALQVEAKGVLAEVDQAQKLFDRIARKDDDSRDGNMVSAARAILADYGLARSDKTAEDHLAQVERYDPELHADLLALMDGLPAPEHHRNLTVADFRAVRERVEALWTLARSTRQMEVDGQRIEIADAAAALAQQLATEKASKREALVGTNNRLDLRMRLSGMRAALRRVEHWADARDRGNRKGPFRTILWQPVSEAVTRYRQQRDAHVSAFLDLLKGIEATLKPGRIEAPELGDGVVFVDRSALLHALLHTGNESNKRKLLMGYGWAELDGAGEMDASRWDRFLDRMHKEGKVTKADWDFVQATWDLLEKTKPAAQRAHKAMYGHYFAEITAEPVQTPFGELRGGYVPAMTDRLLVPESRAYGAMDDMLASQNSPMFPAVNRGFTRSRVENYARPLALDLRLLPAHIDKVTRFAELGPVLRDTARLVTRNKAFGEAMNRVDPTAIESMLAPWLKRVAAQTLTKAPESQGDRAVARIATAVRNRTGLMLMAGNIVNVLQQVTGLSVAALRVPPKHLAGALLELVQSPTETGNAINTLSPWMRQRSDSGARDVDEAIHNMLTNPNSLQRAEQFGVRYGYVLQQYAQNFLDRVVWLGAFRRAESEGVADAVRWADAAVRMTQGSFAPEDAAKVEHAGAFTRMALQFYSFFGGQLNMLATEVHNANGPGRLALVYLLGFAVPAFMADIIAKSIRGDLDDEEGDALAAKLLEVFFVSQARYALAMVPVAGQVGNAALGQLTPERFDDRIGASPAYSALEATVRAPASIYRAAAGEIDPRLAVRDGLTAVGLVTGLPVGPLVRPLGYLASDSRGDAVTVRGLVVGKDK